MVSRRITSASLSRSVPSEHRTRAPTAPHPLRSAAGIEGDEAHPRDAPVPTSVPWPPREPAAGQSERHLRRGARRRVPDAPRAGVLRLRALRDTLDRTLISPVRSRGGAGKGGGRTNITTTHAGGCPAAGVPHRTDLQVSVLQHYLVSPLNIHSHTLFHAARGDDPRSRPAARSKPGEARHVCMRRSLRGRTLAAQAVTDVLLA